MPTENPDGTFTYTKEELEMIEEFKSYVDAPTMTNEVAWAYIDAANGSTSTAARRIWYSRLVSYSKLTDRRELGSEIKLSQKFDHAKEMFDLFSKMEGVERSISSSRGGVLAIDLFGLKRRGVKRPRHVNFPENWSYDQTYGREW